MQKDSLSQYHSSNMSVPQGMKDQKVYEQYKKDPFNYQKIEAIKQLVDSQINLFVHQSNFRQQAEQFYDHIKKNSTNQCPSFKEPHDLSVSQDNDGVRLHFVYNQEEDQQQQMVLQLESSRMDAQQSLSQNKKCLFSQIHNQQMKRRTIDLFERPQIQITPGEEKNLVKYLERRQMTIGMLRRLSRDCIKISLIYQHYIGEMDQECTHQDNCCQKQKDILGKIYGMQTEALHMIFPEGKQSLLRQILANNYDAIFDKLQYLKQKKKNDSKKKKS